MSLVRRLFSRVNVVCEYLEQVHRLLLIFSLVALLHRPELCMVAARGLDSVAPQAPIFAYWV